MSSSPASKGAMSRPFTVRAYDVMRRLYESHTKCGFSLLAQASTIASFSPRFDTMLPGSIVPVFWNSPSTASTPPRTARRRGSCWSPYCWPVASSTLASASFATPGALSSSAEVTQNPGGTGSPRLAISHRSAPRAPSRRFMLAQPSDRPLPKKYVRGALASPSFPPWSARPSEVALANSGGGANSEVALTNSDVALANSDVLLTNSDVVLANSWKSGSAWMEPEANTNALGSCSMAAATISESLCSCGSAPDRARPRCCTAARQTSRSLANSGPAYFRA
mmetsp:Transcript_59281/g.166911  ORF Transcript_59281/g.166911 Transcript_59281/m.166911 type:complete len:280 (+) Transcript_59281:532-1371(+)